MSGNQESFKAIASKDENYEKLKTQALGQYAAWKKNNYEVSFNGECFGRGTVLVCMDEGCNKDCFIDSDQSFYTYNLAGSGILWEVDDIVKEFENNPELQDIDTLTWHEGCGAAALSEKNPEEYVNTLANALAQKFDKSYKVLKLSANGNNGGGLEMTRPPHDHIATATYINNTKKAFDHTKGSQGLPPGFTIDCIFGNARALAQLEVSLNIAFDNDHGFGIFFNVENKYVVVYIGNENENSTPAWISSVVDQSGHKDKVKIKFVRYNRDALES